MAMPIPHAPSQFCEEHVVYSDIVFGMIMSEAMSANKTPEYIGSFSYTFFMINIISQEKEMHFE